MPKQFHTRDKSMDCPHEWCPVRDRAHHWHDKTDAGIAMLTVIEDPTAVCRLTPIRKRRKRK